MPFRLKMAYEKRGKMCVCVHLENVRRTNAKNVLAITKKIMANYVLFHMYALPL